MIDLGIQYGGPGLNAVFSTFLCTFLSRVDCSITVSQSHNLQMFDLPCNSIAVTAILLNHKAFEP